MTSTLSTPLPKANSVVQGKPGDSQGLANKPTVARKKKSKAEKKKKASSPTPNKHAKDEPPAAKPYQGRQCESHPNGQRLITVQEVKSVYGHDEDISLTSYKDAGIQFCTSAMAKVLITADDAKAASNICGKGGSSNNGRGGSRKKGRGRGGGVGGGGRDGHCCYVGGVGDRGGVSRDGGRWGMGGGNDDDKEPWREAYGSSDDDRDYC